MNFRQYLIEAKMYHGTVKKFDKMQANRDEYMIDRAIGAHFASDKNVADKFAGGLYRKDSEKREGEPRVLSTKAPKRSELMKLPQKTYHRNKGTEHYYKFKQTDQYAVSDHVAQTVFSNPEHKQLFKNWVMAARQVDDHTAERIHAHLMSGKAPTEKEFGLAGMHRGGKISFGKYVGNFDGNMNMGGAENKKAIVHAYLNHMRSKGIKGLSYQNTSPNEKNDGKRSNKSYIIFDPEHLDLK